MEALGRVELPTNGLGNRCSIHLSYRATWTADASAPRNVSILIGRNPYSQLDSCVCSEQLLRTMRRGFCVDSSWC
jgi:hypothetical protein